MSEYYLQKYSEYYKKAYSQVDGFSDRWMDGWKSWVFKKYLQELNSNNH